MKMNGLIEPTNKDTDKQKTEVGFLYTNRITMNICNVQGVHLIWCFFPRVLESLPPLPRQHSPAIGCTKNQQPIGVTVHSHCV